MSNEVVFARQFLSLLDGLPTKLSPDHVEDPRGYPTRAAYILPRPPKAMSKPRGRTAAAPGSERSVAVSLRSLRNPPLDIKLAPQPASTTSVHDVKAAAAAEVGLPADKMKLLFRKKPVADSKTLAELLEGGSETLVEFTVMVLGGAVPSRPAGGAAAGVGGDMKMEEAAAAAATATTGTAQGVSGLEVLKSDEFWADLRGFLLQRVRDEKVADELSGMFQKAWNDRT